MPALHNTRRERFAQEIARGLSAAEAHGLAGYNGNRRSACKIRARKEVKERILELQEEGAQESTLDLQRVIQYLEKIIMTPAGEIHEHHPLCEAYVQTTRGTTSTLRCKMPGKLDALETLIKLRGWYAPQKVALDTGDTLTEMLMRVRGRAR